MIETRRWDNGNYFSYVDWNRWVSNAAVVENKVGSIYVHLETKSVVDTFRVDDANNISDWFSAIAIKVWGTELPPFDYIDIPITGGNKSVWNASVFNGIEHNFEILKEIVENQ